MAIPLVNPQLELLPVHFAVDPGLDYNWQNADECSCYDLPLDAKVQLIEQYMDVKVSTMPADSAKQMEASDKSKLCTLPTRESGKQPQAFDRLMHRRCGSLESAQIDLQVGDGRPEAGKKQGSAGISQQIRGAVMKTFGSLGQSMSDKLKTVGSKSNKLSATQSSRRNTLAVQMMSTHQQVRLLSSLFRSAFFYIHTHPFNGPLSRTTQVSRYQKGKPIWILLKQETVSGSGISWAVCKSARRSSQITMPAPHHSNFLRARCPFCRPTNSIKSQKAFFI